MKKLICSILIIPYVLFSLTGCWDRKELNELGIVTALGFDRDEHTGKILLTSQVVRPSLLGKQQSSSKESPYEIVITSGSTAFEAVRNTTKEFDRRSFFSHVKVIVVSEAVARYGLSDIIDFVSRTHEMRKFTNLVVIEGEEAKKVLTVKHGVEKIQAASMQGIINSQKRDLEASSSDVFDFIEKIQGEGSNPITGVFKIINVEGIIREGAESRMEKGLTFSGTAAFKKDKLIGFLDNGQTRGLNFITGRKGNGTIHVPSIQDTKKNISIEIKNVKSDLIPNITDGKISFEIKLSVNGNITEVGDDTDVSDPIQLGKINTEFTEFVHNNVSSSAAKIQKELKTDILGFGSAFEKKFPKQWKNIKDNWDSLFPEAALTFNVKTGLQRTGLLLKPLSKKSTGS